MDADGVAMSVLRLSPSRLDLEVFRGDDLSLTISFVDDAGSPVDVSANEYTATIADIDSGAPIASTAATVSTSTVTVAVGHAVMTPLPSRTAWKLTETAAGSVTTVLAGTLAISDEVE